jgi:hypothetical protein
MKASSNRDSRERSSTLRIAPAFLESSAHTAHIRSINLLEAGLNDGASSDEDDIRGYRLARLVLPKHFSQPALRPVATWSTSQATTGDHAEPNRPTFVE